MSQIQQDSYQTEREKNAITLRSGRYSAEFDSSVDVIHSVKMLSEGFMVPSDMQA